MTDRTFYLDNAGQIHPSDAPEVTLCGQLVEEMALVVLEEHPSAPVCQRCMTVVWVGMGWELED